MANLRIAGLAKRYGALPVLRDVSLNVASGRLVAILGVSGSGKTTLLRLLCGFERADAGVIEIDDQRVADSRLHVSAERRRIGYVAQEGALFPHLSVAENIVFGLPRAARRARYRVDEMLALVGLSASFADRPPQALSGGEQQRVALARALAPAPKLVLLDEPFSALDTSSRADTRHAVAEAIAATSATALLVTHDQSEALSMGNAVAVLRHGRLVQVSDPATLYYHPHDIALAGFVGEAVVIAGVATGTHATCALGTLPLRIEMPEGRVDVLVRPEQIRLGLMPTTGATAARVLGVTFYGHDARVDLCLSNQLGAPNVFARVAGHQVPAPGADVYITIEGGVVAFSTETPGLNTDAEELRREQCSKPVASDGRAGHASAVLHEWLTSRER